jgi:hypothetical protein
MKTTASQSPSLSYTTVSTAARPWLMLISRSALFIFFQLLIALVLAATGTPSAWDESPRWWTFIATLANFASIYLLVRVFNAEGKRYFEAIRFSRTTIKTDLLWFFLSSLIGMPIAAAPMNLLGAAIFGDPMTPTYMLFRPLPGWAFVLSFLFPLTIAFAELPTYFGYVMPRLADRLAFPRGTAHLSALDPGWWLYSMAAGNVPALCPLCRAHDQTPPDTSPLLYDCTCTDRCLGSRRLFDDIESFLLS